MKNLIGLFVVFGVILIAGCNEQRLIKYNRATQNASKIGGPLEYNIIIDSGIRKELIVNVKIYGGKLDCQIESVKIEMDSYGDLQLFVEEELTENAEAILNANQIYDNILDKVLEIQNLPVKQKQAEEVLKLNKAGLVKIDPNSK